MTSLMKHTAVAVLFLSLSGCHMFWARAKPDPIPTPDPPHAVAAEPPVVKVELPGPPPKIEGKQPPEVPPTVAAVPNPPAPKPKGKKPAKKTTTATANGVAPSLPNATAPTAKDPATEAPPVPKLGEILSDDQKLQHLRLCDESLTKAKEAITQLKGLTLSADQKASLARVRIFITQAQEAREKDPQTARQLAERADLLSRDLVRTLR